MIQAILALLGVAGQSIKGWQDRKTLEAEKKLEIEKIKAEASVEAARSLAQTEAEYDNLAQRQMQFSWKDEYLTLVFTAPFILSFAAPFVELFAGVNIAPAIKEAWAQVALAPPWYQATVIGIIAATFGLRWLFKNMAMKKVEKINAPEV